VKSPDYSVGYGGHARCCECRGCLKLRVAAIVAETKRRMELVPTADEDRTIFVRAHFRRGKHLTKMPKTRKMLWRSFR
jgi:hypothetical protein